MFGFSRNPIYLADLLVLIAWAIWLGNVFNIALLVQSSSFTSIASRLFRKNGRSAFLFGDAYREYCARVRRWI